MTRQVFSASPESNRKEVLMATQAKAMAKGEGNLTSAMKSASSDLSVVFICCTKWCTVWRNTAKFFATVTAC